MGAEFWPGTGLLLASGIVNGSFVAPMRRDRALADRRRTVRGETMEKHEISQRDTGERGGSL